MTNTRYTTTDTHEVHDTESNTYVAYLFQEDAEAAAYALNNPDAEDANRDFITALEGVEWDTEREPVDLVELDQRRVWAIEYGTEAGAEIPDYAQKWYDENIERVNETGRFDPFAELFALLGGDFFDEDDDYPTAPAS